MKNKLLFIALCVGFFACKKAKKTPESSEPAPAGTQSLPASTYKRVKMFKAYDTLTTSKKITTTNYQYNLTTGLLFKSTVTDSSFGSFLQVSVVVNTYSYNSIGRVDSYTSTSNTSTTTTKTRYYYNSSQQLDHETSKDLSTLDSSQVFYYHSGDYTTVSYNSNGNGNSTTYFKGDISEQDAMINFSLYPLIQYNYDATLINKSKKFLNETAAFQADCKLLLNEYYPVSPISSTSYSVNYTYANDGDGYPVMYENTKGLKWRVYYY